MIYLASIPRCGSTYLARSLCGLDQGGGSPPDLEERYGIRKLHQPPKDAGVEFQEGDTALFLFGDIPEAVVSTMENRWDAHHFRNCGAEWDPDAPILDEDVLGYGRTFYHWRDAAFPVLFVRYRALQRADVRGLVESWVGFNDVRWLPWRDRRTTVEPGTVQRMLPAYGDLMRAVDAVPDLFLTGGQP